ncbi:hypothetical protein GDO78_021764 [Eleutherodactylus coqui]|uniref:Taste receptor type 2 n=1 Tax=Eleutherodactylus coqui TaxID=57060 RepID=A0A8J6BN45_ELECQ|nr:hypothetical protein GDO78_021764 [Eleutherodactylus coqui]
MYSPIEIVLAVVETAMDLLGFISNGFVVMVNLWDWKCKTRLWTSDYLICSVALSNLSCQLWSGFWFCKVFGHYNTFCQITPALKEMFTKSSFEVGGHLCFFYCTRIVMSKNCLFRFCKRIFQQSLRKVLFCQLITTLFSALFNIVMLTAELTPTSDHLPFNISSISFDNDTFEYLYNFLIVILPVLLLSFSYMYPLLLSLVSAACILAALVKHKKRMRDTTEKKKDPFIDAYRRAGVTSLTLLILILNNLVASVIILLSMFPEEDPHLMLCELVSKLYAPTFGIVLIGGNSKLRSAATRIKKKVFGMFRLHGLKKENISVHIIS